MAEDPTAAPVAAASPPAPATATITQDLATAAEAVTAAEQAAAAVGSVVDQTAAIATVIRNGLSNGPIAQSAATWNHLNTRLPAIVAAIIKEL